MDVFVGELVVTLLIYLSSIDYLGEASVLFLFSSVCIVSRCFLLGTSTHAVLLVFLLFLDAWR